MRHEREEVIQRTIREFELLDHLVASLTDQDWKLFVPRPEAKEAWTVKDALVHITHWKADAARSARKQPRPLEERGLQEIDGNQLIYLRWRDSTPRQILAWHRQVQQDVLAALREAPEEWFSGRERRLEWPFDLDGHSAIHRIKDIQQALTAKPGD